jgi:hypothetical protein
MGIYAVTKNVVTQAYKVDASVTPVAGADDIARYRIVKLLPAGDHTIVYATDATDVYAGVTVCGGEIGDILDVQQGGLAIVEAGGAIAINDPIIAAASGRAATGAGVRLGQAVTAAAALGDLIVVQIDQG